MLYIAARSLQSISENFRHNNPYSSCLTLSTTLPKMHLILTGANSLVSSGVLDAMLKAKGIFRISILSWRPVKMVEDRKDPRINIIIYMDFEKYDIMLLEDLRGASRAV